MPLSSPQSETPSSASPATPLQPAPRHHRIRWTLITVGALLGIIVLTGGWLMYRAISVVNTKKLDGTNSRLSFFQQFTRLVTTSEEKLDGEAEDRINILLLGIGGPGHDGPYLTDTMMVVSYKPSTNQIALLSLPRDLVVQIPGRDYRKINGVLAYGRDADYPGGGEALVVNVVGTVLDMPIQYYARIDFKGFEEVIDEVNGVTVDVERAFQDNLYPDAGYGYDPIAFEAGRQLMDGVRALKFARSRKGNNNEGTDFARAARQQKVLFALKEKLVSFGTLTNPKRVSDILGALGSHSQTNMEVWEMVRLAKMASTVKADNVVNKVLDNSANGLLVDDTGLGGAYILVPRSGTYKDIQFLARNIFLIGQAEKEKASILVVNASNITGLGESTSRTLTGFGLTVHKPLGLRGTTVGATVLIDASQGSYPRTLQVVGNFRRAQGSVSLAQWIEATGDETVSAQISATPSSNTNGSTVAPSIVLILGRDQPKPTVATTRPWKPVVKAPSTTKVQ